MKKISYIRYIKRKVKKKHSLKSKSKLYLIYKQIDSPYMLKSLGIKIIRKEESALLDLNNWFIQVKIITPNVSYLVLI